MPPTAVHVYNPDDEADRHSFNGLVIDLAPNQTTDLEPLVEEARAGSPGRWEGLTAEHAADHLVAELSRFGVCRTRGAVQRTEEGWDFAVDEDEETILAAEATYDFTTREWANQLSLGYHKVARPYLDAGIAPLPTPSAQEQKALDWLAAHPTPVLQPAQPPRDPLA